MSIGTLSFASHTGRFLEALERMRTPQGEELVSSGPSPVPKELAREFEQLMEQGSGGVNDTPVGMSPNVEHIFSPEQLYRVQFALGMLRLHIETVSKISQQASQGIDSLLRTQS